MPALREKCGLMVAMCSPRGEKVGWGAICLPSDKSWVLGSCVSSLRGKCRLRMLMVSLRGTCRLGAVINNKKIRLN